MMRKLLLAGASIEITDHKGNTPLHIAAKFSSTRPLEEIAKYISIPALVAVAGIRNNEGHTCIHVAAKNGNMEILRKFRNLGIDMDMQVCNVKPCVTCISCRGSLRCVRNPFGNTPLSQSAPGCQAQQNLDGVKFKTPHSKKSTFL